MLSLFKYEAIFFHMEFNLENNAVLGPYTKVLWIGCDPLVGNPWFKKLPPSFEKLVYTTV